jgi:hypothetical protein
MVGCINAIVGGVTVALAGRSLLQASVPVAAVIGAVVALGLGGPVLRLPGPALPAGRGRGSGAVCGGEPGAARVVERVTTIARVALA